MPGRHVISAVTAIVAGLSYFFSWSFLASPFTPIPGDDAYMVSVMTAARSPLLDHAIPNYVSPVYYMAGYFALQICNLFTPLASGCNVGGTLLHLVIASNAVVVLLLGLLVFRLTQSLLAQFAAHAIYALAAWPVTYHFMVSYTATTSALLLLTLYLAVVSKHSSRFLATIIGITTAFVLWSSPAGPLTAGLLTLMVFLLRWNGGAWRQLLMPSFHDGQALMYFSAGLVVCAVFFGYFAMGPYVNHLLRNIHTEHYTDAFQKFGFTPRPPVFSYLFVLSVYGYINLLALVAALAVALILMVRRLHMDLPARSVRVVGILIIFIALHTVLIDVLASTKLGRSHFPVYPTSVVVITVIGFAAYKWLCTLPIQRNLLRVLFFAVFAALIFEGVHIAAETRQVRTAAVKYLDGERANADLYILREDPHHWPMWLTFNWSLIDITGFGVSAEGFRMLRGGLKPDTEDNAMTPIEANKLKSLLSTPGRKSIAIVLGPHGHGSGLSLAHHDPTLDFRPGLFTNDAAVLAQIKTTTVLPYYMHYPPFLMEEEISQALYFSGQIPDYRMPELGITVLRL